MQGGNGVTNMVKTKKMLSLGLVMLMIFSMFSAFSINASAATTSKKSCISYYYTGANAGKTTYRNEYYTIAKNKKVTLECFWNTEKLNNQTSVGLQGKKIKNYLRFDVHIIDKKTGKVVNYWYGLKANSTFKVYSSVAGINRGEYQVKVTSYLSNYKTYKNSDLCREATYLKYRLKY